MTDAAAISELADCQARLLNLFAQLGERDGYRQYHPELSPLGWHLGHCVYTESYWIREVVMQAEEIDARIKRLYIPELSEKSQRSGALPGFHDLYSDAQRTQAQNRRYLEELCDGPAHHELLDDLFLVHFLKQHYAQHIETSLYALNQRTLENLPVPRGAEPLRALPLGLDAAAISAGEYPIGSNGAAPAYDNERPRFNCELEAFAISRQPVSNGQYLSFMQEGGYEDPGYWNKAGRQWLRASGQRRPEHWRRDAAGYWYGVGLQGAYTLRSGAALSGISHFEASAFAAWAGARLPHEYEWETAKKQGLLQRTGECWEWCANEFHPYQGFRHYPYAGYSVPYFNNRHYTLRGGSRYTHACIKRPTFRNYYRPDKRHISAGIRLALP